MANGGNIVVPVGVQLELNNVQEIISSLQKAMSNVKPETKGYSAIVNELSKAEKRADSLASKLKQGFTTNAGIQSFTKGFEDLIALVDTINGKVAQVNFDNLVLTPAQQAQMEAFAKQIEAAKDAYNAIETSKIQEAIKSSQELKANFDNLKINPDTTTLDNAIKTIKAKVDELQKEIDSSEKKAVNKENLAARRQDEYDQLKALRKSLKNDTLTQDFAQFFDKNGNFKSNGKQAFVRLLEQLGLDDETVEKVKNVAGSKIKDIQDELDKAMESAQRRKNKSRIDAQNAANEARADIAIKTKEKASYETSQGEVEAVAKTKEVIDARQELNRVTDETKAKEQEYQETVEKSTKGNAGAENARTLADALDQVRQSGGAAAAELANLNQRAKTVSGIKNAISMWMGFNQVMRLTKTAIRNIVKDIRDLDKVMTEIAVVTNMSQSDLWKQMGTYQNIAKQYGVATTGVYQVSQIYYQQGLQTSDVMALTNETLKMAKIAGLDYGKAADYMTVAIRGFKMEMTDAQNVVDVYSNLAAKSAVDTTELATAMSKTASSAAAVGSSFENTSAMIAMMVETTRESAENIGSALKSIISRYGEMTSDPSKLVDSEGEALSLNKVDKALQSVGISLHDAQGQFRDFDDVILELSSKWDTLDKNSQRYIATIMAGNRLEEMLAVAWAA